MSATSNKVNIQPTHKCFFCRKTNVEVAGVLIAGDGVSICQECVFLCVEIVFKHSARTDEPTAI
ncbi:ClpX C4-type zinc finger protein [Leclercia sp. TB492]|uniref:ClpX C4-type zinc finger protein n=1 Tax=Leclercia sp. TB492 TaxID=3412682 RepID=UPI003CEA4538